MTARARMTFHEPVRLLFSLSLVWTLQCDASISTGSDLSRFTNFYLEGGISSGSAGTFGPASMFGSLWDTDDGMIFADIRGAWGGESEALGSYGFGFRHWTDDGLIIGNYVFYDRYRAVSQKTHEQILLGFEVLTIDWDVRLNAYLPDRQLSQVNSQARLRNGSLVVEGLTETAYYGSDLETGYLLKDWKSGGIELRAYLAGYWFDRNLKGFDAILGSRARAELRLFDLPWLGNGSRVVMSGQYEWDRVRESQGTAAITLRVPLQFRSTRRLDRFDRRKLNPIVRRPGVFVENVWTIEPANFTDGRPVSAVTTIDRNTESPTEVIANLGTDSLVIIDGSSGPIDIKETLVMADGQALIGGGAHMEFVGQAIGNRAWFVAPGTLPVITQNNRRGDGIQLPQQNGKVYGVKIYSQARTIFGEDTENTALVGNLFGDFRTFNRNRTSGGTAIRLTGSQTNVDIRNNLIGGKRNGLYIEGSVTGVIANNVVKENRAEGIRIDGDLLADLNDNVIEENGQQGLLVMGRVQGAFSGNTFAENEGHGAEIRGEMSSLFSDNLAMRNGGSGFVFSGTVKNDVSENIASENEAHGFLFNETVTASIAQNTAERNQRNGLFARKGLQRLADNVFNENGADGRDGESHGLRVDGSVQETITGNEIIGNTGFGVTLFVPGGETVRFENNSLADNNLGSSEFMARLQTGNTRTAYVQLRENISVNETTDARFPNYRRFSLLELIDDGGNVGVIQR